MEYKKEDWNYLIDEQSKIFIGKQKAGVGVSGEFRVIIDKYDNEGKMHNLTGEEIFNLIQDGMKFKILKKAEGIKKEFSE
ncbi:hypothetical protein COY26_04625 [Candidatus Woesearchaeota archaeon CG_4_10_14_0_2_um_filter_33_10]|nr:MAG: hypothetical protein COS79_03625 [Candidatus Woesearchaeota archaeon CG06_land_8_20_14_3_00_33_13]PIZ52404.1 MAG: hypothetical protein COY26_04625 [Candidatus Woesearchaeota archaeon CG_4_10_14_0_2_um_filter_33_10]